MTEDFQKSNANVIHLFNEYQMMEDGPHQIFYPSGQIKQTYSLLNGKLSGTATYYEEDGRIRCQVSFKEGVYHGSLIDKTACDINDRWYESHYENGLLNGPMRAFNGRNELVCECAYQEGLLHGAFKKYKNGRLTEDTTFLFGKRNGVSKTYQSNGHLYTETSYKNDVKNGWDKIYDSNGIALLQTHHIDGHKDGLEMTTLTIDSRTEVMFAKDKEVWKKDYQNNLLTREEIYTYETIPGLKSLDERTEKKLTHVICYDKKGAKEFEYETVDGIKNGPYQLWHDGNVLYQGKYVNGEPSFETAPTENFEWFRTHDFSFHGQEVITFLNDREHLAMEKDIKDIETKLADLENKEPLIKVPIFPSSDTSPDFTFETIENGDHQLVKSYIDGRLESEMSQKDGRLDGATTSYDDSGNITSINLYKDGQLDGESVTYFNGEESSKSLYHNGVLVQFKIKNPVSGQWEEVDIKTLTPNPA